MSKKCLCVTGFEGINEVTVMKMSAWCLAQQAPVNVRHPSESDPRATASVLRAERNSRLWRQLSPHRAEDQKSGRRLLIVFPGEPKRVQHCKGVLQVSRLRNRKEEGKEGNQAKQPGRRARRNSRHPVSREPALRGAHTHRRWRTSPRGETAVEQGSACPNDSASCPPEESP